MYPYDEAGQVGLANGVIRFGFSAVPWAYDRLVGPLFTVVAQDLVADVERGPGNVLESNERLNGLHGHQGNALVGAARNVAAVVRGRRTRRRSGAVGAGRSARTSEG